MVKKSTRRCPLKNAREPRRAQECHESLCRTKGSHLVFPRAKDHLNRELTDVVIVVTAVIECLNDYIIVFLSFHAPAPSSSTCGNILPYRKRRLVQGRRRMSTSGRDHYLDYTLRISAGRPRVIPRLI